MKADGSVLIDTKISTGGMEKGFNLLKSEMSTVGTTAKQVSSQIESSFSGMNLSKSVSNAISKVKRLETQLAAVSSELKLAMSDDDDSATERLLAKKTALYDRLEEARENLATEIAEAARKEADAEEKAAQRSARAAEKKANAQKKETKSKISDATSSLNRFNTRFTGILSSALFFNIISSGLSKFTSYMASALEKNDEFSSSLSNLKGSLLTAFQPIYNSIVPALTSLVNWLNTAVQMVGKFFSVLTGSDYSDVMDDAEALNSEADAIGGVGDAAEEASRQLAGFDELNRLESLDSSSSSSGSSSSGVSTIFEEVNIPSEWEEVIESLALTVKDIFFEWDDLNAENITEKLLTALTTIAGGVIGFSLGGVSGALIGMAVGASLGVAISNVIFDGDGELSSEELLSTLITVLTGIVGGVIGFALGGSVGAAIGMTVGAALGLKIADMTFDGDGELSKEEVIKLLTTALVTIGGGVIGFAVGGAAGAAIGIVAGASIGFTLSDIMFDGDGNISSDEMLNALVSGLIVIAGTVIGFAVGGPAGAAIGAVLGLALTFTIQSTIFDGVGETVKSMLDEVASYFSTTFSDRKTHV